MPTRRRRIYIRSENKNICLLISLSADTTDLFNYHYVIQKGGAAAANMVWESGMRHKATKRELTDFFEKKLKKLEGEAKEYPRKAGACYREASGLRQFYCYATNMWDGAQFDAFDKRIDAMRSLVSVEQCYYF